MEHVVIQVLMTVFSLALLFWSQFLSLIQICQIIDIAKLQVLEAKVQIWKWNPQCVCVVCVCVIKSELDWIAMLLLVTWSEIIDTLLNINITFDQSFKILVMNFTCIDINYLIFLSTT